MKFLNIIGCIVLLAMMGCGGTSGGESSTLGSVFNNSTLAVAPRVLSGLSAADASSNQINLAWTDNSSNEIGFKIERKTGTGGTYVLIAIAAANAISYHDTGLTASTAYYYRILVFNKGGDSEYTIEVNATTQASGGNGTSTVKLPKTGQTTCYDAVGTVISCIGTGQDGELQIGVAWPNPRFVDNSVTTFVNQTITDKLTGLIWTKDSNIMKNRDPLFDVYFGQDGIVTWKQALDYVKKINAENYLGYNDWRLPNRNELASLVNSEQANSDTFLNGQGFIDNYAYTFGYWSSSNWASLPDSAWIALLADSGGGYSTPKTIGAGVWPVRSEQFGPSFALSLPKTGQITCYDAAGTVISCTGTGQDGELQIGVAWPNPRFMANTNQTVTDNLTGLIWSNNGNLAATTKTWQQALDYIKNLNTSRYQGYSDWRLPNRNELASLVNLELTNSAISLNLQEFSNIQSNSPYWSSSTYPSSPDSAWAVHMNYGHVKGYYKYGSFYVWPVRGGW